MSLISVRAGAAIGAAIARLGYSVLRIRRTLVDHQLRAALPELTDRERRRIASDSYANLGYVAIEAARLARMPREELLAMFHPPVGWEHLERAVKAGRGALLIGGHFGNWEVAFAYVAARGIPLSPVGRRMTNPLFNDFVEATRARFDMQMIGDREMVAQMPRRLAAGHVVPILADQGAKGVAAIFVPFFGRLAQTPKGPAVMALRHGTPCFFVATPREPDGRYRMHLEPLQVPLTGDRERDVEAMVAEYTARLEHWVRRYPGQYLWQHRRWRRRPDGTFEDV